VAGEVGEASVPAVAAREAELGRRTEGDILDLGAEAPTNADDIVRREEGEFDMRLADDRLIYT
jgi:hypothetical protein